MKLTKKKLVLGLVFAVATLAPALLSTQQTLAANFVNGNGAADSVNTHDNTRFTFLDPFTIQDNKVKDASGNPMIYKTASTACGSDNMYVCQPGDVFYSGSYWYWPAGNVAASVNGQCVSALVLAIQQSGSSYGQGTGLDGSRLYVVNAHQGVAGGACYVQDDTNTKIAPQDITGWGANAVSNLDTGSHSVDTIVNTADVIRVDAGDYSDQPMFHALATDFTWINSSEIDSIMHGHKLEKVTDAATLASITAALARDDASTKPLATNADYYLDKTNCVDSQNNILALLAVRPDDPTVVTIIHRDGGLGTQGYRADTWHGDQQSCLIGQDHWWSPDRMFGGQRTSVTIGIADVANATAPPGSTPANPIVGGNNPNESATVDCGGQAFNWLVCPLIKAGIAAADQLDGFIMNQLNFDVGPVFDTGTTSGAGYYKAWSQFRLIATALLVIGGLVMVASQAFGFEILDAYTIRKVLPRILIAVIGISLSWPLMKLVVEFFDTLGVDLRQLIYAPFNTPGATISATTGFLSSIATVGLFVVMGPAALTFIITALLAVFVGFLILVIRQVALIVLIILAPVAIAFYILPNTQKLWKLWYDNFLGLLLMFPIISALIAAGHVFAAVAVASHQGSSIADMIAQAIGIIAYFVPYFLLPLAARLATGVIGNLAGIVNDRHKGAFDRLKGARGNASQKNLAKMKAGNRFSDRNALTRGFNRTTVGAGAGWQGRFGVGTRGAQAVDQAHRAAVNNLMKDPHWATIQDDDDTLRALTYNNADDAKDGLIKHHNALIAKDLASGKIDATEAARKRAQVSANADRAVGAAQASVGFGRPQSIAAAQQLAATGTGYVDMEDQARTIARASGGDKTTASSIAGFNNAINKQKGRYDLAPSYGTLAGLAHGEIDRDKGGTGPDGKAYADATVKSAQGPDAVTLLRGKPQQVENLVQALAQRHKDSGGTDQQVATQIGDLLGGLQYASPEVQAVVEKHIGTPISKISPRYQGQAGQGQQVPGMPYGPQPPAPGGPQGP